jgi:plastocyanin
MRYKHTASRFWVFPLLLPGLVWGAASAMAGSVEVTVSERGGKPAEDAVVYLVPAAAAPTTRAAATAGVMDQQDKEFVPHVLSIFTGTAVNFPNRDNIKHHVYSFSSPKKFELPLYTGMPASPVVFDKPGVVVLGCNIHDWMVGYIYVAPTPYFAKTGSDGKARLTEVPAGAYEVRVWHPRIRGSSEPVSQQIAVGATDTAPVGFVLSLKREWKAPRGPGRYENTQGGG